MVKSLMPYGSEDHSELIFKSEAGKRVERLRKELAKDASRSTGGSLAKGGWGKLAGLDEPASRLVRRNVRKG